MTRFGWIVLGIIVLILAGIAGAWYLISSRSAQPIPAAVATTTPETDLTSSSIYTNGKYGLSIVYPDADADAVTETFTPWRAGAIATGTPILSLADQDGTLRIGASNDAKEVKACVKPGPAETTLADMRLGSTTLKAFTRDEVGTENQTRITSYRVIHENACVAMETFQALHDGSVTPSDRLNKMLQSFSFARP